MYSYWTASNWQEHVKGSLRGFFDIETHYGLIVHGVKLFEGEDEARWIGFPSREFKDEKGETGYTPILEFADRHSLSDFRKKALEALDHLSAFGDLPRPKERAPKNENICPTCFGTEVFETSLIGRICRGCGNSWLPFPNAVNAASKTETISNDLSTEPKPKRRGKSKPASAGA